MRYCRLGCHQIVWYFEWRIPGSCPDFCLADGRIIWKENGFPFRKRLLSWVDWLSGKSKPLGGIRRKLCCLRPRNKPQTCHCFLSKFRFGSYRFWFRVNTGSGQKAEEPQQFGAFSKTSSVPTRESDPEETTRFYFAHVRNVSSPSFKETRNDRL